MEIQVKKWGNSLALRIPKPIARRRIGVETGSVVRLSLLRGADLTISPAKRSNARLDDLLAGVTEYNLHGETDTGPAMGKEVW